MSELRGAHRNEWGPWKLDPELYTLTHTGTDYEIDLEICTSPAEVLDWIIQIADKQWADALTVSGLVQAFNTILEPQAFLCLSTRAIASATGQSQRTVVKALSGESKNSPVRAVRTAHYDSDPEARRRTSLTPVAAAIALHPSYNFDCTGLPLLFQGGSGAAARHTIE